MRVLLFFIDGLGIGAPDAAVNPLWATRYEFLSRILGNRMPSLRNARIESRDATCIAANATLRIDGLPQSGTGQATLYTGVNCARVAGKHFGPYLYSTTKPIVAEQNIFRRLLLRDPNARIALANGFPQRFFDYMQSGAKRIVAGVAAAQAAGVAFRTSDDVRRGTALSTDITAQRWHDAIDPTMPVISPYEAGARLAAITMENRLTLFEYFVLDKAGHERSMEHAVALMHDLDQCLAGVFDHVNRRTTLVCVTSDHGNAEDLSTKSHTRNPVPVLLFGDGHRDAGTKIRSIQHVAPFVVDVAAHASARHK